MKAIVEAIPLSKEEKVREITQKALTEVVDFLRIEADSCAITKVKVTDQDDITVEWLLTAPKTFTETVGGGFGCKYADLEKIVYGTLVFILSAWLHPAAMDIHFALELNVREMHVDPARNFLGEKIIRYMIRSMITNIPKNEIIPRILVALHIDKNLQEIGYVTDMFRPGGATRLH